MWLEIVIWQPLRVVTPPNEKDQALEKLPLMSLAILDFEKSVTELERKIQELKRLANKQSQSGEKTEEGAAKGDSLPDDMGEEIARLEDKVAKQLKSLYANLSPWQKAQVARHPDRPHFLAYVEALCEDFQPLSGDRAFHDDQAIIGGLARFRGERVMVIGQEKGHDMATRVKHNFGMARPEGYRKAIRLMALADRFNLPILTFVDTSGAYPGVGAEERGQAEAIARSIEKCLDVSVPIIATVIGEGGSGGAIAIAAANQVLMLEHAIYSVISPEGCASILWRDGSHASDAANALKLTAQDLKGLKVIDEIVAEPLGGAHRDPQAVVQALSDALYVALQAEMSRDGDGLKRQRRQKFLDMGRNLGVAA